jgi:hypothetical protein
MSTTPRKFGLRGRVVVAAGLAGTALLPGAGAATAEPAFSGFATEATATPVKLAVFEPVVPIPSEPQAELDIAYTTVQSATGPSATGRASWLWPGDAVGEGCKTFLEAFHLGETGLCDDGYPVMVNSQTPGGPEHDHDEPMPGAVMRTSTDAERSIAKVGWSPDGKVEQREPEEGDDEGSGEGGGEQPESPLPVPGDLSELGAAITGKQRLEPEPEPNGLVPEELAAVVDAGQMTSVSEVLTGGDTIRSVATSRLKDVALLNGVIGIDVVKVVSTTTSNGRKATTDLDTRIAGITLAGTPIVLDRRGVRLADQEAPLEGLPADPNEALQQIGVRLVLPKGERSAKAESATAAVEGLRVELDLAVLRKQLDTGPLEDVVSDITKQFPDEAAQLKSAVGALFQVAPKLVLTLGNAASTTTTVQGIDFPMIDVPEEPLDMGAAGPGGSASGISGGTAAGSGAVPPAAGGVGGAPGGEAVTTDEAIEAMGAGLPPLTSIPGALLVGGIILASGVGWWLQRIGGFVLGGAGACAHGLESGVPDLRKA